MIPEARCETLHIFFLSKETLNDDKCSDEDMRTAVQ